MNENDVHWWEEHLTAAICSGRYERALEAVSRLVAVNNTALWLRMIGDSYIDHQGNMWAAARLVQENPVRQQVVDFACWELFANAPNNVWAQLYFRRPQVVTVRFRRYATPPSLRVRWGGKRQIRINECLRQMPPSLWRFGLKEIRGSATAFRELPPSLGKCHALEILEIESLQSKTVPTEIGNLKNLESLILNDGLLSRLPGEFSRLKNLQELDLSENRLKRIPAALAGCKGLIRLNLRCNQLVRISSALASLENLQELDLTGNRTLSEIDASLIGLRRLTSINTDECDAFPVQGHFEGPVHLFFDKLHNPPKPATDEQRDIPWLGTPDSEDTGHPAIKLIVSLLRSYEEDKQEAGFRLLLSSADPDLAEKCLPNIHTEYDEEMIRKSTDWHYARFIREKLMSFLTSPDCPATLAPGSWRNRLEHFIMPGWRLGFISLKALFPQLKTLGLDFDGSGGVISSDGLEAMEILAVTSFDGTDIRLDRTMRACRSFRIMQSKIREELCIDGLEELGKIQFLAVLPGMVRIADCPKLEGVELEFPEEKRWGNKEFLSEGLPFASTVVISNCPALKSITLLNARMSTLEITGCPRLEYLKVVGSGEEELTFRTDGLPRLRELTVKRCRLREMPDGMLQSTRLVKLNLEENELTGLPEGLQVMYKLESLFVSGNRFTTVPESISGIRSLVDLDLGWQTHPNAEETTITELPDHMSKLTNLKFLSVTMPDLLLRQSAGKFRRSRAVLLDPLVQEK